MFLLIKHGFLAPQSAQKTNPLLVKKIYFLLHMPIELYFLITPQEIWLFRKCDTFEIDLWFCPIVVLPDRKLEKMYDKAIQQAVFVQRNHQ